MSLYDYTMYVVREAARGSLFADAQQHAIVRVDASGPGDREGTCIDGRVRCIVRQSTNTVAPSLPLEVMTLALDDRTLEATLAGDLHEFLSWLWKIADVLQPACFFMTGGSDMNYQAHGKPLRERMFTRLPALITDGEIVGIHPIMFFAERIANGIPCKKASGAPWPSVEYRPGVGCLLLLISGDPSTGAFEIMEPGSMYDGLFAYFEKP